MVSRRDVLTGSLLMSGLICTPGRGAHAATPLESQGGASLIALPGKKPLIKRSYRPPNFETPLHYLRAPFTANDAFFVRYHMAVVPEVDARSWRLEIGGSSVARPLSLSLADIRRGFEHVSIAAINQCSGNRRGLFSPRAPGVQWGYGAMGNATWTGVRLRDVLEKAGIAGDALEVIADGADQPVMPSTPDFQKSLPIDRALDRATLIAFEMNGRPLPHWHGAPARLVVPGWTATYWMKHLSRIRVEPKAFDGFWMKSGYRLPIGLFPGARFTSQETADSTPITEILVNSLVTSHGAGDRVAHGRSCVIEGWSWDAGVGISAVEISADGGQSWKEAQLGKDLGKFAWRGFSWRLDTTRRGVVEIGVRARSRSGAQQPDKLTVNPSGYHHNAIQWLRLEVA